MKKTKTFTFFYFAFFTILMSSMSAEEPWSVSPTSPTFKNKSHTASHSHIALNFYQKYISSFDGPRCMLSPTCSAYAANSFQQHGYVLGLVLTSDRLMHESAKINFLKISQPKDWLFDWKIGHRREDWYSAMWHHNFSPRFRDPVLDNSYWWK